MGRLHHARQGEGPPLLLIQGLGGHSAHWGKPFPAALAEDFDVVTFDHVGTGRSEPLAGEVTIAGLADDAAGLLSELEIERSHVLGLSMGGMVAQELALQHPHLVERLVLVGTSPSARRGVRTPPETMEALGTAWTSGDPQQAMRVALEVNVSAGYAADPAAYEAWREIAADRPVGLDALGAQLQAIRGHDALERLAGIDAPTLIMHGTEDRVLPVGNARLLADAIPAARVELFEGAGHLLYLEEPERAAGLVREFLL